MGAEHPIGKRLKERRLFANLTQEKLGVLAGIEEFTARARINQYEHNTHVPGYPIVKKIANALKIPTPYFYAEEDDLAEYILNFKK